jgi:hypothetical protein
MWTDKWLQAFLRSMLPHFRVYQSRTDGISSVEGSHVTSKRRWTCSIGQAVAVQKTRIFRLGTVQISHHFGWLFLNHFEDRKTCSRLTAIKLQVPFARTAGVSQHSSLRGLRTFGSGQGLMWPGHGNVFSDTMPRGILTIWLTASFWIHNHEIIGTCFVG